MTTVGAAVAAVAGGVFAVVTAGAGVCSTVMAVVAPTVGGAGNADVEAGAGVGAGGADGCGVLPKIPLAMTRITAMAMTATAMIAIFFTRRRCFFFRTISLYRSGRYGSLNSSSLTDAAS
jgi:hypothetical protein